ncbi:MAG: response regulator [Bacteroidetes bacterium]|nr:response regulator [Bacteroidota bacterium]
MKNEFKYNYVWVIDDNTIDNYITDKVLKKSGMAEEVSCFSEANLALISLKSVLESSRKIPEVIFLDISMPVMNGFDFLDEFIKIKFKTNLIPHIVMLSSSSDQNDISKALTYSVVSAYLNKPLTAEAVLQLKLESRKSQ